jgi:hypothetical protein
MTENDYMSKLALTKEQALQLVEYVVRFNSNNGMLLIEVN